MDELSEDKEAWRGEVVRALQAIEGLLARLVVLQEHPMRIVERTPGRVEATGAANAEMPGSEEPLGTWILTDERVSRIEEAVEQEQRIRGRVYGG